MILLRWYRCWITLAVWLECVLPQPAANSYQLKRLLLNCTVSQITGQTVSEWWCHCFSLVPRAVIYELIWVCLPQISGLSLLGAANRRVGWSHRAAEALSAHKPWHPSPWSHIKKRNQATLPLFYYTHSCTCTFAGVYTHYTHTHTSTEANTE